MGRTTAAKDSTKTTFAPKSFPILAVVAVVLGQAALAWGDGKSLLDPGAINWRATERLAEIAAGTVIASAFFAWYKTRDNDPVKEGGVKDKDGGDPK